MKRIFTYTLLMMVVIGCQKVDLNPYASVGEGDATIDVVVSQSAPDKSWSEATRSYELTPSEEQQIKSIEFLVFNSSGALVSRQRIANPASHSYRINTKAGANMSIYVVTNLTLTVNASGSPIDVLGQVTTLADLQNIKITNMLSSVVSTRTMIMSGLVENQTILPGSGTSVTIPLNFVAAKITVNIRSTVPAPSTFEIADWKLGSLALYTYIFPRPTDAVNPANPADFLTQSATNLWKDTILNYGGVDFPVKTTTFYIFENRRGTNGNTAASQKSGANAPFGATKLIARGYFRSPTGVTGVDVNLMFGANSINDYNVERTKQYTYNVDVRGINDINVDTRYSDSGVGFQADVVNPTLDAHYDFRPLSIMACPGVSVVTILDQNNVVVNPADDFWLTVSALNITKFVDNGAGLYVRPSYDPLALTYQATTTHTPTTGLDTKWLYLYADEFLTENGTRTATVQVVHTPTGGTPLPVINIAITQRGILLAGNVGLRSVNSSNVITTTNYRLGTELIEEATLSITPGNLVNERTLTMQWGFNGTVILPLNNYTLRNGKDNTSTLVMSNTATGALRPPYGRNSVGTISHQAYDPIYNTYAARYCFEKNRDTDGNGVIVGAEVKWYLPSVDEQLLINAADLSWSPNVADRWMAGSIYTSSSQYSATLHLVTAYSNGNMGATVNTRLESVRCVRQM